MSITASNNLRLIKKTIGDAVSELIGWSYVVAMNNKVEMPDGDFFLINVIGQQRQATNIVTHETIDDIFYRYEKVIAEISVQFDFIGLESQNAAMKLEMLSRSAQLIDAGIAVLYGTQPKQLPFEDAHKLMRERWEIELQISFNNTFTSVAEPVETAAIIVTPLPN